MTKTTKMIDGNKMTGKYFPIKTDTSCRLKWAWSSIYLNSGTTGSCHRASTSKLNEDNFDNFHNTPEKLLARKLMLEGQWPGDGCEYCQNIEMAGGTSDRQFQLLVPEVYPRALDQNNSLIEVSPSVLEVFFSNTCNFKCVYCNSTLSSSIQFEEKKFGQPVIPIQWSMDTLETENQYKKLVPLFWKWLKNNSNVLQRLHIMGGEPFLQKDLFDLIEYFQNNPNPKLEFTLVTNLHVPATQFSQGLEQLSMLLKNSCVKRVDILVSVDCWGDSQEYVRYGFDMKIFENNLKQLMSFKEFRISLNSTVCSLTIHEMPNLARKFLEWNQERRIFWQMGGILPPHFPLSWKIFDYSVFEDSVREIASLIPSDSWDDQQTLKTFLGIANQMKEECVDDRNKQQELFRYLDEFDRRRNENWKIIFPWLKEIQNNVV